MKEDKRKVMINGREENVSLKLEVDRATVDILYL